MTSILPLTPRTPSGLLAALALAPVLAPLNTINDDIPPVPDIPDIALMPPTPSQTAEQRDQEPPVRLYSSPHDSTHRMLSPNEARQLTLLMTQHFMPVRHSSKAMMQASIRLAEGLHQHGIRWDRHRRVMGTHLRGIWEEGLQLVGGSEHIMRLCRPGPMDQYLQRSLVSITEPPHPVDPAPLAMSVEVDSLAAASRAALTTEASLFHTLPGIRHDLARGTAPSIRIDARELDLPGAHTGRLRKSRWAQRKNTQLTVITDPRRTAKTLSDSQTDMTGLTAMSLVSVSELRWHLLRRARYRVKRAFRTKRPPKTARRHHFGAWEMR